MCKNILVIGDIILDKYIEGDSTRVSPEAASLIVGIQGEYNRLGGAGNVAKQLSHLDVNTYLVGYVGKDTNSTVIRNLCKQSNIKLKAISVDYKPTICKTRVIARNHQLLRLDWEDTSLLTYKDQELLRNNIEYLWDKLDAVIISDYCKGTLSGLEEYIIFNCITKNIPVLVDTKCNSNELNKYHGATCITPNLTELQNLSGLKVYPKDHNSIIKACEKIQCDFSFILATLGEHGMFLWKPSGNSRYFRPEKCNAQDITGAGDTVISSLTYALADKIDLIDAVQFANIAASIVVEKVGTSTVSLHEIHQKYNILYPQNKATGYLNKIITKDTISTIKNNLLHYKLVLTNGCFDILHKGHFHLLQEAKKLGDTLIVAVNSDKWIREFKGSGRPVVPQKFRIEALAALPFVDYVILFDTEEELLNLIIDFAPNILVKGSDYKGKIITGQDIIKTYGGKLIFIDILKGYSTTTILSDIGDL